MKKKELQYRQDVAFINREKELCDLKTFVNKRPSEILFIHGPKSSGKTTLLYKSLEQIQKEQKLDVKFMDLRETFTNVYEDFIKAFFNVEKKGENKEKLESNINSGSMWEIQYILSQLFEYPIDEVLADYKQKMLGMITYYIVKKGRKKREKILKHFTANDYLWARDTNEEDEEFLRDMVTNNILYFDPTLAVYYPQGKSYQWGIRLYFKE